MEYRLVSNELVDTPGIVKWMRHVARTDRPIALEMAIAAFPDLPGRGIEKLLAGDYREEMDKIIVEV